MSLINICKYCGMFAAEKEIDYAASEAICPYCNSRINFNCKPLCLVGGASGVGKTSILHHLLSSETEYILLDSDVLWHDRYASDPIQFMNDWLRLIKNMHLSDARVVLFGAGFAVPDNIAKCVESRYFSSIRYLALTCSEDILKKRLSPRPEWRNSHNEEYIKDHVNYNHWIYSNGKNAGGEHYTILDTSSQSIEASAAAVRNWISENCI